MSRPCVFQISLLAPLMVTGLALAQQPPAAAPVAPAAQPVPASAPASQPAVDPKALEVLKSACDYLAKAKSLTFEAEIEVDHILDTGQCLEFTNLVKYAVRRPNQVAISDDGEAPRGSLYYDGKTLTLYNRIKNVWATTPMTGSLEDMMKRCAGEYDIVIPLGDLLFANPYQVLTQNLQAGGYIGQALKCGVDTHHLAFDSAALDWQIWIQAGDKPLPYKVIVDFKNLPGTPRFSAVIYKWNLNPDLPESTFTFTPSKGAEKVELLAATQPVHEAPAPAPAKPATGK